MMIIIMMMSVTVTWSSMLQVSYKRLYAEYWLQKIFSKNYCEISQTTM